MHCKIEYQGVDDFTIRSCFTQC